MGCRFRLAVFALPLAACATSTPKVKVDLTAARAAVEEARQAGAPERAAEPFKQAEQHLGEAEALVTGAADPARQQQADALGRVVVAEAQCATRVARLNEPRPEPKVVEVGRDTEKLTSRARKAEEEQRRLEQRVQVLQKDLQFTETEVIRAKAKLKGLDSKAEASAAIAEARIVMRRAADDKGRTADVSRCQEVLTSAEQQLKMENYGAAAWLALKARGLLDAGLRGPADAAGEHAAPQKQYLVKARVANIRQAPAPTEPVVGKAPQGTRLEASVVRGDWVKVTFGSVTGWVSLSVLE